MTRADLIDSLSSKFPYQSPITVDNAVREIFEILIETLAAGERIEIRGLVVLKSVCMSLALLIILKQVSK